MEPQIFYGVRRLAAAFYYEFYMTDAAAQPIARNQRHRPSFQNRMAARADASPCGSRRLHGHRRHLRQRALFH
jgi:hypothetical protein